MVGRVHDPSPAGGVAQVIALEAGDVILWAIIFALLGACISVAVEICYDAFLRRRGRNGIRRELSVWDHDEDEG